MERAVFDRMAEQDQVHWWYVARRKILADLIAREADLPEDARILEIGCGTGHNFEMLRGFGRLDALEVDDEARALASSRLGHAGRRRAAARPGRRARRRLRSDRPARRARTCRRPRRNRCASIAAKLAPGGQDPGHRARLSMDVERARPRPSSQAALFEKGPAARRRGGRPQGREDRLSSTACSSRSPPRCGSLGKLAGKTSSDDKVPPRPLNALFEKIFGLERHVIGRMPFPAGVSLFALLSTR